MAHRRARSRLGVLWGLGRRERSGARLAALLFALALVAAACGGDDNGATGEEPDPVTTEEPGPDEEDTDQVNEDEGEAADEAAGPPEMADIVVATIPIMAMAPFFHAQDAGYFADEGLNVEWQVGAGGAQLIPRVLAGEVHIFWTAIEPFLVARAEGVELDLVAQGHSYGQIDGEAIGVYVLPDSGFETIADLEGATIGVNTLNSLGHIYTTAAIQHAGVDVESVRWVEIDFPQMAPAMERGEIDAAWTPEPFVSIMAQNLDAVPLLDPETSEPIMADIDEFRDVPGGAWAASRDFVESNPNTVAAFERAIRRANLEIQGDHDLGVEVLVANTESNEDILNMAAWPSWSDEMTLVDRLQVRAEMMAEFGMLDEPGDTSDYVHVTAR
jgi:ABC-type nitrate/sulfonate/bicarbonate transport system substrate-binding protein